MDRLFEFKTTETVTFTAKAANNLSRPTGIDTDKLYAYTSYHDANRHTDYWYTGVQANFPPFSRYADWGASPVNTNGQQDAIAPSNPNTWAKFKQLLSTGGSQNLAFALRDALQNAQISNVFVKDKYLHLWYLASGSNKEPQQLAMQIIEYSPGYRGATILDVNLLASDDGSAEMPEVYTSQSDPAYPVYLWVEDDAPTATGTRTISTKLWAEVESGIATDQLGEAEPVSTFIFRHRPNFFTINRVFTDEHDRDWQITGVVEIGRREFMQVIAKPYIPSSD